MNTEAISKLFPDVRNAVDVQRGIDAFRAFTNCDRDRGTGLRFHDGGLIVMVVADLALSIGCVVAPKQRTAIRCSLSGSHPEFPNEWVARDVNLAGLVIDFERLGIARDLKGAFENIERRNREAGTSDSLLAPPSEILALLDEARKEAEADFLRKADEDARVRS